ncbi:MAG: NnrS family protein [Sulfurovum sp.]
MHLQFSEDSQKNYFFSQPHQPFFVLAFINAIITMVIFLLSYNNIIHLAIDASGFHIYGIIYLLFTPAFFAFLFTTFPRFTSTPAIPKPIYMRIFSLFYLSSILFLLGSLVSPVFSGFGMVLLFVGHFMGILVLKNIYDTTELEDKVDIFWILLAMSFGLLSHLIFIVSGLFYSPLMGLSIEVSIYLYLFLVTFSVAQRMVPFFSHSTVAPDKRLLKIIFGLLVAHILLEGIYTNLSFIVDIIIAILVARELLRWKLQFPHPNPMVWILHTSLYWVPIGFLLGALSNFISMVSGMYFMALDVHVIVLGFVFTMLIGFGTRVTLGHSGARMEADRLTKILFYSTQLVVFSRIIVSIVASFGYDIIIFFNISISLLILLFVVWGAKFFKLLIYGKR